MEGTGSRRCSEWKARPLASTISALALRTNTTARLAATTHRGSSVALRTKDLPKPHLLAATAAQSIRAAFRLRGCGGAEDCSVWPLEAAYLPTPSASGTSG